ncbi:hypothetical protein QFC22_006090 [Naganishia vaughanmartiniae]|uniref:Uncharacterized protein n=1 Tax=Naganishia vaughanmartiniae TaxID=1424756 RepID=A0ACC2WQ98_9TREE|nr:hypothetical protein QFC22_006090 [Naganishia vaughanmartiniae]
MKTAASPHKLKATKVEKRVTIQSPANKRDRGKTSVKRKASHGEEELSEEDLKPPPKRLKQALADSMSAEGIPIVDLDTPDASSRARPSSPSQSSSASRSSSRTSGRPNSGGKGETMLTVQTHNLPKTKQVAVKTALHPVRILNLTRTMTRRKVEWTNSVLGIDRRPTQLGPWRIQVPHMKLTSIC